MVRKTIILITALTLFTGLGVLAAITNSPHDLSTGSSGVASTNMVEICGVCHVPHNAQATANQIIPLWSHTTAAGPFTNYGPTAQSGSTGTIADESLACMSCHDGVTGLGNLYAPGTNDPIVVTGVNTGTNTPGFAAWSGNDVLGTDLSNDHPVGIALDTGALTGYKVPASAVLFPNNADGDNVECASCHEVHNANNEQTTNGWLLRASMADSVLCLDCHVK